MSIRNFTPLRHLPMLLPHIECIPRELLWAIIDHAPDTVHSLRRVICFSSFFLEIINCEISGTDVYFSVFCLPFQCLPFISYKIHLFNIILYKIQTSRLLVATVDEYLQQPKTIPLVDSAHFYDGQLMITVNISK